MLENIKNFWVEKYYIWFFWKIFIIIIAFLCFNIMVILFYFYLIKFLLYYFYKVEMKVFFELVNRKSNLKKSIVKFMLKIFFNNFVEKLFLL